ncbi:MAG: carboxypeptidase regulatory-like domain-containing protein, partial [bacterium]|nr:carboxypeptidase regulatory-like domain-containing protein [bacterium]
MVETQTKEHWQYPVRTDRNGDYTIQGLVPGEYEVMLNLRDAPYELTGGIPTRKVTVHTPTERVTGIDFVVEAAGLVWGYVLGDKRDPVRGSEVLLCSDQSIVNQALSAVTKQAPPVHDKSNDDGFYELMGVPLNQEWRVYALSEDWAPQLSDPFILTDRARSVRVDLYVLSGTDVYGRVVSSEGGGVPRADTFCIPSISKFFKPLDMPPAFREVRSEEDGSFVIHDLPAGDYQVLAQKDGFKFAARGRPIHPDGYSDIHHVEIVLIPVETGDYAIYGMVMDPWDNPIEGAHVTLFGGSAASMTAEGRETTTDAQGNYVFVGVDAGFYMLTCSAEGYATKNVSNVRLQEPTDIVLEPTSIIRGRVLVRETGMPPESYSVRAIPELEEGGSIQGMIQQ